MNQNSKDILEKIWQTSSIKKKRDLLSACELNQSWAETTTIKEMVNRGGGLVAKQLYKIVLEWKKINPHMEVLFK